MPTEDEDKIENSEDNSKTTGKNNVEINHPGKTVNTNTKIRVNGVDVNIYNEICSYYDKDGKFSNRIIERF